jgi:hypothetical protein
MHGEKETRGLMEGSPLFPQTAGCFFLLLLGTVKYDMRYGCVEKGEGRTDGNGKLQLQSKEPCLRNMLVPLRASEASREPRAGITPLSHSPEAKMQWSKWSLL